MLKITLNVTYADARTAEVTALPLTQVAFEREHGVGIGAIATEQKVSHVYWLAWHATKPGVPFDAWLETVASIDVEVGDPAPLPGAPSAG